MEPSDRPTWLPGSRLLATGAALLWLSALAPRPLAQCQTFKLWTNDGALGDAVGTSVALSGSLAIVGAEREDGLDTDSGAAYLFDVGTGLQTGKLLPTDGAAFDCFGGAVSLRGTTALVGAARSDANGVDSGAAYVFDASSGAQVRRLTPEDGSVGDRFGSSVALNGLFAIVGAQFEDDLGFDAGSVYLFDLQSGSQVAKLRASDGSTGDHFGFSLSVSGGLAVIGAPDDDDFGSSSGSAYVFDLATRQQIAKLVPADGLAGDQFGYSVAVSGTLVLVGAQASDAAGADSGAAYLFDATTSIQLAKLTATDAAIQDRFGYSVALSGTQALIGAWGNDDRGLSSGSAYLFDATSGTQVAKLLASDGAEEDNFGYSVALEGTSAVVGAVLDDDVQADIGSAYAFVSDCELTPDFAAGVTFGTEPLSVDFTDLSSALPPVSAWSWDFGDGGTSTLQTPTHVYVDSGTFDVTLTVGNGVATASLTKVGLVVVTPTSSATVYNGNGTNPLIFATVTDPVLGTTWTSQVDGNAIGSTSGLTFVFGYFEALDPGLMLGVGELLIDVSSPFAVLNISVLVGGVATHNQAVPNDPSLAGVSIATQAFVNQTPGGTGQLANALLLVFGTT